VCVCVCSEGGAKENLGRLVEEKDAAHTAAEAVA